MKQIRTTFATFRVFEHQKKYVANMTSRSIRPACFPPWPPPRGPPAVGRHRRAWLPRARPRPWPWRERQPEPLASCCCTLKSASWAPPDGLWLGPMQHMHVATGVDVGDLVAEGRREAAQAPSFDHGRFRHASVPMVIGSRG